MLILYLLILIAVLWGFGIRKEPSLEAALSTEQSTMLKGVFVMLVFTSHVGGYLVLDPTTGLLTKGYLSLQARIGQLVVLPFLFYSGYGLRCSIEKKGTPYLRSLPSRRVLRIYLHAFLIITVFLIVTLMLGARYTPMQLLTGYLLLGSFGNSTWYIFAIICLYLFTWFSFTVFRKPGAALCSCFLLTLGYYLIFASFSSVWWYDTIFVFWFGLIFPYFLPLLRRALDRGAMLWVCLLLLLGGAILLLTYSLKGLPHGIAENLRAILAMLFLLLLLERVRFGNRVLFWVGRHVFEFYMLQRLPMILLSHFGFNHSAPLFFVCASIAGTAALVYLFGKLLRCFDRLVFRA